MEQERNELLRIARKILKKINVIQECEVCDYYTSTGDLNYGLATNIAKNEYNVGQWQMKEFHDCLKEIYDEAGVESINVHFEEVHLNRE